MAGSTTCSSPIRSCRSGPKADRLRALAARARLRLGVGLVEPGLRRRRRRARATPTTCRRSSSRSTPVVAAAGCRPAAAGALAREAADLGLAVVGVFTHGGHGYAGPTDACRRGRRRGRWPTKPQNRSGRRHRAAGRQRRLDADGPRLSARRGDRGTAGHVRVRRSSTGRPRCDRPRCCRGGRGRPGHERQRRRAAVRRRCRREDRSAKDVATYVPGYGEIPELDGAIVARVADYHGIVDVAAGRPMPEVGRVVLVVPNHICPVVNLRRFVPRRERGRARRDLAGRRPRPQRLRLVRSRGRSRSRARSPLDRGSRRAVGRDRPGVARSAPADPSSRPPSMAARRPPAPRPGPGPAPRRAARRSPDASRASGSPDTFAEVDRQRPERRCQRARRLVVRHAQPDRRWRRRSAPRATERRGAAGRRRVSPPGQHGRRECRRQPGSSTLTPRPGPHPRAAA